MANLNPPEELSYGSESPEQMLYDFFNTSLEFGVGLFLLAFIGFYIARHYTKKRRFRILTIASLIGLMLCTDLWLLVEIQANLLDFPGIGQKSNFLNKSTIIRDIKGIIVLLAIFMGFIGFPQATIVAAVMEKTKELTPGQKRSWKKTKRFFLLSVLTFAIILVSVIIKWISGDWFITKV